MKICRIPYLEGDAVDQQLYHGHRFLAMEAVHRGVAAGREEDQETHVRQNQPQGGEDGPPVPFECQRPAIRRVPRKHRHRSSGV
jgi:hypothetical protein